jgi:DNA-binding NtrC family response regulator
MQPAVEVLLIEDEESDRLLVQEVIALRGRGRLRITDARDLATALGLLDARSFDLILLDTRLRDVSALSALRSVGEHAPHTPILPHPTFLTTELRQAAKRHGTWEVAVRGLLDPMWAAISDLLALKPSESAAEPVYPVKMQVR